MKPLEVHQFEQRLDNFQKLVAAVADLELKSHLARYFCVLVSGYLERAVEIIFTEFALRQSSPVVANFVSRQLSWNSSLNMQKILAICGDFDPTLAQWAEAEFSGEITDAINSVKNNRDGFAHGGSGGIGWTTVSDYHARVRTFVQRLSDKMLP